MRSRSARLSVYCRTIARSSEAHAQNGASCSSERRRRRAIDCLSFQTRVYLVRIRAPDLPGFQAPLAEGVQVGQRGALYCRVSTADQSCDRQERDLRALARRSGFEIVGVYKEKASGAKTDRIERKKVMALAQLARSRLSWSPSCPDGGAAPSTSCRRCNRCRRGMCPFSPSQACNSTCRRRTAR